MSTDYGASEMTTHHRSLLIACWSMQRFSAPRPFCFTCTAIAELLRLDDTYDAWYFMKDLRDWGLVELVVKGGPRKPSLYRVALPEEQR